jgi:hypothetical protein
LIGVKQDDHWHIFDFAGDGRAFPKVNVRTHNNVEYSANKISEIDYKAIYLGPSQRSLYDVEKFAFKEGIFHNTYYKLGSHNCRHFCHTMAEFMGVAE